MKRLASSLLVFASLNCYSQWNTSGSNINNTNAGNVGIGTSTPTAKLEITPAWNGQSQGLKIWGGNSFNTFGNSQILFSYGGGDGYSHVIKTRHMSSAVSGNAFDFYVWQPGDPVSSEGSLHVMTLDGNKVGLGTTNPFSKLHILDVIPSAAQGINSLSKFTIDAAGGGFTEFRNSSNNNTFTGLLFTDDNLGGYLAFRNAPDDRLHIGAYGGINFEVGTDNSVGGKAERIRIDAAGNLGIGTASPSTKLSFGTAVNSRIVSLFDSNEAWYGFGIQPDQMRLQVGNANSRFSFFAGDNTELMTVKGNGNVGIGTTTPTEKLTVKGRVFAQEVKVVVNVDAPDYVFEKDYKLPSLDEIKSYIDQHKHLPEVPSAKEMEQNGINLSEMNMILLKKVEEMMLHILELKRQNDDLQKRVAEIELKK